MTGIIAALHSLTFHHQNHEVSHCTTIDYNILVFSLECLIIKHKLIKIVIFLVSKFLEMSSGFFVVLGFWGVFFQLFATPPRA